MGWFLCSISRSQPRNWDLCKEVGLFAVTTASRTGADRRVQVGDHLLFWVGGRGYTATGLVTGDPYKPRSRAEAPWPGGTYNFRTVIPFQVQHEPSKPLFWKFVNARQIETGFASVLFQMGMTDLSSQDATRIVAAMLQDDMNGAPVPSADSA
ncbi:MAG: hypothetical protein ACRDWY_12805 [Actinomycetes bacterium]